MVNSCVMTTTTATSSGPTNAGRQHGPAVGNTSATCYSTSDAQEKANKTVIDNESQKKASDSAAPVDLNSNHIPTLQPNVISTTAEPQPLTLSTHLPAPDTRLHSLQVPSTSAANNHGNNNQWLAQVAAQTHEGVRQRMSQASDQLDMSLRQLYASASSIAADVRPPSYHNIPGIVPYYAGRSVGPPPSYDDVINPYAPPPSYHSLFGQMREARKSSRGLLDLLRRLLIILVSTLGCTLLVAFMILIPFTMIIVGAVYIDECRIEHIPAFLLVGGLVWATKNIIHCYSQCRQMPSSSSHTVEDEFGASVTARMDHSHATSGGLAEIYLGASRRNSSNSSSSSNSLTRHLETAMTGGGGGDDDGDSNDNTTADHHLAPSIGEAGDPFTNMHLDGHQRPQTSYGQRGGDTTRATTASLDMGYNDQGQQAGRRSSRRLKSSICESLLNCVLFGWFIAGCVIVFRNYEPDFENPASLRYCHKTVYMYTFWLISSAILLLGFFIGCICCLMVSSAVASRQDEASGDLA